MKYLAILFLLFSSNAFSQLTLEEAKEAVKDYDLSTYSYHQKFEGHQGYAAPLILTTDGGAIFFTATSDDKLVAVQKLDKTGEYAWRYPVHAKFSYMETQSVIEGKNGDVYAFLISYDTERYRGGSTRVIHLNKSGELLREIMLGDYTQLNNPHASYIRLLDDGRLSLRGHISPNMKPSGVDPESHFWEGWLNADGELTQKTGKTIDWADESWKDFFDVDK